MTWVFSRLVFGFMWLLQLLPFRAVASIGNLVGSIMFWLIPERRRVTRINLQKCFPQLSEPERERLARAHFRGFCRSFLERGILWWASRERIRRFITVEGDEHLRALSGKRAIVLAPHFLGLDAAASRLSQDFELSGMYSKQKDPLFDRLMYQGRARFGGRPHPRQAGIRKALREIHSGRTYYYLPDMDFGPRASIFVPFFGVPAATTVGLSYIARSTAATVVPCVTRMLPEGGYVARFYPAWTDFPSGDAAADARRMVAFIEERVLEMPEQYFWMHKRFKTRPAGEPKFY